MPDVQLVLLFGSYATGRRDLLTDLDLLVVMQSPLDFVTRSGTCSRLRASVALDLLVYARGDGTDAPSAISAPYPQDGKGAV